MASIHDNGWSEWQNHVLAELKRLSESVEKLSEASHIHREKTYAEIAALKVKSGVWGVFGGSIPALVVVIWYIIDQYFSK